MKKIINLLSLAFLVMGALFIHSCAEEVNPFEGFRMPTEADTNSRYLVCEIDGREFFARGKNKKGSLGGGADITISSISTQYGFAPNLNNSPISGFWVSEDFQINNERVSEFIGLNFFPNLETDSIFTNKVVPLGKAAGGETPMCFASFIRVINRDNDHPRTIPYTETSDFERGEIKFSTIGFFDGYPIYNGTFWFDVKNPETGEIIKIRNGRFNHNISFNFPDMLQGGSNSIVY